MSEHSLISERGEGELMSEHLLISEQGEQLFTQQLYANGVTTPPRAVTARSPKQWRPTAPRYRRFSHRRFSHH